LLQNPKNKLVTQQLTARNNQLLGELSTVLSFQRDGALSTTTAHFDVSDMGASTLCIDKVEGKYFLLLVQI
jgi:hypothetical protein